MAKTETEPEFKREKDKETVTGRVRYKEEWEKKNGHRQDKVEENIQKEKVQEEWRRKRKSEEKGR